VFWRIPAPADSALQELGGSRVYATEVQINGAPGSLSVHVIGEAAPQVRARLAKKLGLAEAATAGGAFLTSSDKGRVTRFLVLPSAAGEEACVTLTISQSAADAARARQKPAEWPSGVPALAATPLFSAVCAATRTAFVTAETGASPEAAIQDAAGAMRQAGWSETRPSTPAFRILVSGRKTCLLSASRDEKTGTTTISLLQREGATP
jgi:hypothetical protein